MLVGLQLPDGASLERTDAALAAGQRHRQGDPGRRVGGGHLRHCRCSTATRRLANAGVAYVILEATGACATRQPGQDLRSIVHAHRAARRWDLQDGRAFPLVPPAIQGIGNAGGFQMQVEQKDGSFDYVKLQNATPNQIVSRRSTQTGAAPTSSRRSAPARRTCASTSTASKAETLQGLGRRRLHHPDRLSSARPTSTSSTSSASSLQVFLQADSQYRLHPERHPEAARAQPGRPDGADRRRSPACRRSPRPPLISLYNLYRLGDDRRRRRRRASARARRWPLWSRSPSACCRPTSASNGRRCRTRRTITGNQLFYVFALAMLLVYLCLAGQYESWIRRWPCCPAVPLALIGPGRRADAASGWPTTSTPRSA